MGRRLLVGLALGLLSGLWSFSSAPPCPFRTGDEAGGMHRRLETAHGPVHVWTPDGYDPRTAGVVVYVHGYFTAVDQAWQEHRLADQFRDSGLNAVFIAPAAPAGYQDPVAWPDLAPLLEAVERGLGDRLPGGPLVVAGHSGAFRTIAGWVGDRRIRQILLIDALYHNEAEFARWLAGSRRTEPRQLVLVALETLGRAERFVRSFGSAVRKSAIPESPETLSATERRSRLLLFRSQYEHMELVTGGKVLPALLRLGPLGPAPAAEARIHAATPLGVVAR
mgnify:CR=1 FL=1